MDPSPTTPARRSYATLELAPEQLERAVGHLVRLVDADSTSGREAPAVDVAEAICGELALPVQRLPAAPGRDNLLVGASDPRILFCTHLDTVPPFIGATRDAEAVHGRGACDAKGCAVAMLHALALLAAETSAAIGCLLVVGEETDHLGTRAATEIGLTPAYIVLGEPVGNRPAVAQKGLLKLSIRAVGRSAHSAYPDQGVSAVHRLLDGLAAIRARPLPADKLLGATTVNIGQIEGGVAANVIAPAAEAVVLIRCAAPVDAVLAELLSRLDPELEVTELSRAEPLEFLAPGDEVGPAVPFNTDGHTLLPLGARLVLLGPGDMRVGHSEREELAIADLAAGIEAYARLAMRLL